MFAKLKEKIQKEGGNVSEGDKTLSPLPGLGIGSPRKVSVTGNVAQGPLKNDSLPYSSSSDDLSKLDFGSKEEVIAAFQRRTEQCKKLEAKVTEYAAVIKDNAKKIEKLEGYIEKQQDSLAKRTQELNEQYQASRAKMADNFKQELEQKEKEKQELLEKLKETEGIREKFFKKEEEKEEMQEFTTQEMAKLKHMLILREEELSKCQKDLQEKSQQLDGVQKRNQELSAVEEQMKSLQSHKSKLEEEISDHGKIVSALAKERMTIEETLNDVRSQLSEKTAILSNLEARYTELESAHQTLVRNSDIQKNKLEQKIQEQTDQIEQFEDRVKLLKQREQDQTLTGDDRLIALEKERDGLERKLTETREQLTQIKSSWSEKISHLEDQISHLNGKIVEDSEELNAAKQYTETVRQDMQKQIEVWKDKLKTAERQAQDNQELVNRNEAKFKKERLDLETAISKVKLEKVDLDTHLRAKLASVESELMSLELAKSQEKNQLTENITKLEKKIAEFVEKLDKSEQQVKTLEDKVKKLQSNIKDVEASKTTLKEELHGKEKQLTECKALAHSLQEEVILTQEKLDKAVKASKSKSTELQDSNKDKDDLMLRNAELSQKLTSIQQTSQDEKQALESELKAKTEREHELVAKCQEPETKLQELSNFQNDHQASNEEVTQLQDTVSSLEEQLAEKNKVLKKQEQKLNDLRKTLQRELKVQSLPNDDPIDTKVAALTPPLPRKNSLNRNQSEHHSRTRNVNSHDGSPPHKESVIDTVDGINNSYGMQDFFVGDNTQSGPQGHKSNSAPYISNHATITVNETRGSHHHSAYTSQGHFQGHSQGHTIRTRSGQEFDTRHLEKDINFQYLKHVVMKFMLSREHEALHLIKAVSLLLRFTPDEQKLIRDTLEWKMSWFGGSQPPAVLKGQTSKIIPPSW